MLSCFPFPGSPGLLLIPSQQRTEIIEPFIGNPTSFMSCVCLSRQTPLELPRTGQMVRARGHPLVIPNSQATHWPITKQALSFLRVLLFYKMCYSHNTGLEKCYTSFPFTPWHLLVPKRALYMESTDLGLPQALEFVCHVISGKSLNFSEFQSCPLPYWPRQYHVYKMLFTIKKCVLKHKGSRLSVRTQKGKTQNLLSRIQWRTQAHRQSK